jgi:hypothetical protein
VNLDERGHTQRLRVGQQRRELGGFERGDDQQDEVGAVHPSFVDLISGDDEILAEHGHGHRGSDGIQVGQRPVKPPLFGENTDHACAATLIGGGKHRRVLDGGQRPTGRAGTLDFGDDADTGFTECGDRIARRWSSGCEDFESSGTDLSHTHLEVGTYTIDDRVEHA